RRAVINLLSRDMQDQVSVIVELDLIRAFNAHRNVLRIGAGRDDEIVFERLLRAVKGQIDSGIDFTVFDTGIVRNVGMPLPGVVTDQVVALGGEQVRSGNLVGDRFAYLRADWLNA